MSNVVWIHPEIGELTDMERSTIAIEYFVRNMKKFNQYTQKQMEELSELFSREVKKYRKDYNQTS